LFFVFLFFSLKKFLQGGKHPYVYISMVAIQLIAEITARVNTARGRRRFSRAYKSGEPEQQFKLRLTVSEGKRSSGDRVR
jgi:hypothetical protein